MKKAIMTMMAAMIATTGTALAATPEHGFCRDNAPAIETSYAHCGDGYYGGGRGGRGGYGCGGGHGHHDRHGGYCYDHENNEG